MNLAHQEHHEHRSVKRLSEALKEFETQFERPIDEIRSDKDRVTSLVFLGLEAARRLVQSASAFWKFSRVKYQNPVIFAN